jgi:hypothetical protein
MTDKDAVLEETLEGMLVEDVTISARAAVRRSNGALKHATDITRNENRKAVLAAFCARQLAIRSAVERSGKRSRVELEKLVATKNAEIERLKGEKDLLIASHKAMILSITEMGGFSVWKRFFDRYQTSVDALEAMRSLPEAVPLPFDPKARRR